MITRQVLECGPRMFRVVACALGLASLTVAGCGPSARSHPAVGRGVGKLPLVSIVDGKRPSPTFVGRVTLLNFWGTWCPPCRRELPGLGRIASRLETDPRFQLVAISCGSGGPDDVEELAADTRRFLERERIDVEPWADPRGLVRMLFSEGYGFEVFPTTYLIGSDGRVRRVWSGYHSRDEADIAAAVIDALKAAGGATSETSGQDRAGGARPTGRSEEPAAK